MEAGKSKTAVWAGRLETKESRLCSSSLNVGRGRANVRVKSEDRLLENSLWFGEAGLFVLFRPSADYMRLTYIMEGNLLYLEFTNLNVNLIQKHPPN